MVSHLERLTSLEYLKGDYLLSALVPEIRAFDMIYIYPVPILQEQFRAAARYRQK